MANEYHEYFRLPEAPLLQMDLNARKLFRPRTDLGTDSKGRLTPKAESEGENDAWTAVHSQLSTSLNGDEESVYDEEVDPFEDGVYSSDENEEDSKENVSPQ